MVIGVDTVRDDDPLDKIFDRKNEMEMTDGVKCCSGILHKGPEVVIICSQGQGLC